jgi:hypothetical protein
VCSAAACVIVCANGQLLCDGRCVDPRVDPANCGGCRISCGARPCANGACR